MMIIREIGFCGLATYGTIFIITLHQLKVHLIPYYEPFYSSRKIYHILLCIYCLLQAISFLCFCQGHESYTKFGYTCHIFGILAENIAISAINLLWAKIVIPKFKIYIFPILCVGVVIYSGYIIFLVQQMTSSSKSFSDWAESSDSFSFFQLLEPCILGINGILFFILGLCIWLRLKSTPSWESFEKKTQNFVHVRLFATITLCCASIFLRVIFQIILTIIHKNHLTYDLKWIFTTWIPNLIPALIFLYALRIPDRPKVIIENQSGKVMFTSDTEGKRIRNRYQFLGYVPKEPSSPRAASSPQCGQIDYALLSETTLPDQSYSTTQYDPESDDLIPILLGDLNSNYSDSRGNGNYSMNIDYRDTEYSVSSAPDYVQNILQNNDNGEDSERGSLLMVRDTDEKSSWSDIGGLHGKYKWRESGFSTVSSIEKEIDGGGLRIESHGTDFTSAAGGNVPYFPQTEDI